MTLSAPPPVQDPVRTDPDDLVIKEARRRARHRRWRYVGVGAAAATLFGVAAACGPGFAASTHLAVETPASAALATTRFLSLPPDFGTLPSTPETGEVVAVIPSEHWRVWVYGDGRMITMRMFPFTKDEWPNSGFLVQHLTPAGVEMMRTYAEAGIGANNLRPLDELSLDAGARSLRVLVDGRMYGSALGNSPPNWWRCHWGGCEGYLASLNHTLPASAWADKEYERFVPANYVICFGGELPDGQRVPPETVLAALPVEAANLLSSASVRHVKGPLRMTEPGDAGCATMSLFDARTLNNSLKAAGLPVYSNVAPVYQFTIPATPEHDEITVRIPFMTILPNGEVETNGA